MSLTEVTFIQDFKGWISGCSNTVCWIRVYPSYLSRKQSELIVKQSEEYWFARGWKGATIGHIVKSSGTKKPGLIERWKHNDSVFLTSMFSPVSFNNVNLIESICYNGQTGLNISIFSRQNNISISISIRKSILVEVNGERQEWMQFYDYYFE